MKLKRLGDGGEFEVEILAREGNSLRARIEDREVEAILQPLPDGSAILTANGQRIRVFAARRGKSFLVAAGPLAFEFATVEGRAAHAAHGLTTPEVTAPMPGKILKVMVAEGERVEAGQALVVMEAMKMETTLVAESPAIVAKIRVTAGAMVDHGDVLIELSPVPGSSAPRSVAEDS
jgi:acetyl/propionyl-CoA carboxylase alpha subunit